MKRSTIAAVLGAIVLGLSLPVQALAAKTVYVPPQYVPPATVAGYPGPFALYNLTTGKCAQVRTPTYLAGARRVVDWATQENCEFFTKRGQRFVLVPYDENRFVIQNEGSDNCLGVFNDDETPRAGDGIMLTTCNNSSLGQQLFYLEAANDFGDFTIVNDSSRLCLDVSGYGNTTAGITLGLYYCSLVNDDHMWGLIPATQD